MGLELRDSREEQVLPLHDPETGHAFLTHHESDEAREEESVARQTLEDRIASLEARLRVLEGTGGTHRQSPE